MTPDQALEVGRKLDRRFHALQSEGGAMDRAKDATLAALTRVLDAHEVAYAIIGGVAVQLRRSEPRTTLNVDLAVLSFDDIPVSALVAEGFRHEGRHAHLDNWRSADGVPVQLTEDPLLADAVRTAERVEAGGMVLRVATAFALVRAKLRAARDPARRRSKRVQDLADAIGLVEDHPEVVEGLEEAERGQVMEEGTR